MRPSPWLANRITANQVLVGPMSLADLKHVIEQPALGAGLRLEDGLADAVLQDAGSELAALPLVSHAMAETWRRRDGETLTLAGYREAGGVAGSISQTADSLYESVFDDAEKQACRRLMLRLVTPGEGTSDSRRRLQTSDLDYPALPDLCVPRHVGLSECRNSPVPHVPTAVAMNSSCSSPSGAFNLRSRMSLEHDQRGCAR